LNYVISLHAITLRPSSATLSVMRAQCDAKPMVTFLTAKHNYPLASTKYIAWWQRHSGSGSKPWPLNNKSSANH